MTMLLKMGGAQRLKPRFLALFCVFSWSICVSTLGTHGVPLDNPAGGQQKALEETEKQTMETIDHSTDAAPEEMHSITGQDDDDNDDQTAKDASPKDGSILQPRYRTIRHGNGNGNGKENEDTSNVEQRQKLPWEDADIAIEAQRLKDGLKEILADTERQISEASKTLQMTQDYDDKSEEKSIKDDEGGPSHSTHHDDGKSEKKTVHHHPLHHHHKHKKSPVTLAKSHPSESCNDACHRTSEGKYSCRDSKFEEANSCEKLAEHFDCPKKCLGGYGPDKPGAVQFTEKQGRLCFVHAEMTNDEKKPTCSAAANNVERLCPCGPKEKLADTNKILRSTVESQTRERTETQKKLEEVSQSLELLFDRLKGARSKLVDTTKTLQELRAEDAEMSFLNKLMEAAQNGDVDYETGDIKLPGGQKIRYSEALARLSALNARQRERRNKNVKTPEQDTEDLESSSNTVSDPALLTYDLGLMQDIAVLLCAAAFAGTAAGSFKLPPAVGYLLAGMLVGPSGLGYVTKLSSVSTVSQFGVVFPLFTNGMHFGLKLVDHSRYYVVSVAVAGIVCVLCVGLACLIGYFTAVMNSVPEAIMLGIAVSLSSPTGAMDTLSETNQVSSPTGRVCLGILAVQDLLMGLLLSIPHVIVRHKQSRDQLASLSVIFEATLRSMFTFAFMIGGVALISKMVIPRARSLAKSIQFSKEIVLLGLVAICLTLALISESMGLSLEMGAFFAGLMLTSTTEKTVGSIIEAIQPLNDIFGGMFLASIGLVLNPGFVFKNLLPLSVLLVNLVALKAVLVGFILICFNFRRGEAISVGLALAQIAEYSLAFTGKAHALGLISRRSYLFFLTVTVLSTAIHPLFQQLLMALKLVSRKTHAEIHDEWESLTTNPVTTAASRIWNLMFHRSVSTSKSNKLHESDSEGLGQGDDGAAIELEKQEGQLEPENNGHAHTRARSHAGS